MHKNSREQTMRFPSRPLFAISPTHARVRAESDSLKCTPLDEKVDVSYGGIRDAVNLTSRIYEVDLPLTPRTHKTESERQGEQGRRFASWQHDSLTWNGFPIHPN